MNSTQITLRGRKSAVWWMSATNRDYLALSNAEKYLVDQLAMELVSKIDWELGIEDWDKLDSCRSLLMRINILDKLYLEQEVTVT